MSRAVTIEFGDAEIARLIVPRRLLVGTQWTAGFGPARFRDGRRKRGWLPDVLSRLRHGT